MLEAGKCYRANNGDKVRIGGRIKAYSESAPFVWSIGGNWYDEQTGAFINSTRTRSRYPLPLDHRLSIGNHQTYNFENGEPNRRATEMTAEEHCAKNRIE